MTASAIISFSDKLEGDFSDFYSTLAEKLPESRALLLSFVKQSKKNQMTISRTYRETISDALEACFSFENLNLHDYEVQLRLNEEDMDRAKVLKTAISAEDRAYKFYMDVANRSDALLATIPSAFRRVAKERQKRKQKLESLLASSP